MRVTSTHIIDLAAQATSRAQSQVATTTATATSGLRVQVPSDDPVAWADAQRAKMRQALSTGAGGAIEASRTDVQETDSALSEIGGIVAEARQLAVQGSSMSPTSGDRAAIATQVQSLYNQALAAANSQGTDGHYLLAGSKSGAAAFDPSGVYQGDDQARQIDTGDGATASVGLPGSYLTSAHGVDVLPELQKLATALGSNDIAGVQASLGTLTTATAQVNLARGQTGTALSALTSADNARATLQTHLTGVISDLVEADTVGAASSLAQATTTLAVARAVSEHVISTLAPSS